MKIDIHVHCEDHELQRVLEKLLQTLEGSVSAEDQKLLDDLNAKAERRATQLAALDAQNSPTLAV